MSRILSAAALVSGFIVLMAVGCARSASVDLDGDGDGPTPSFWAIVHLAVTFSALPLLVIWLFVLIVYARRRTRPPHG